MFYRILQVCFTTLGLFLLLTLKAQAFIFFSSDEAIEKQDVYFHEPCQQFNSDQLGVVVQRDCDQQDPPLALHQSLIPLLELDQKLTKLEVEQELLNDLSSFVEKKVDENLESLEFIRSCLRDSLRKRALHEDCTHALSKVRASTQNGLPLLREHMALMDFAQPLAQHERNSRRPGFQVRYYQEQISHPHSSLRIERLTEEEKERVEQYVQKFTEQSTNAWYEKKMGTTRCLKTTESGEYFFDGPSCERVMRSQLAHHINNDFKFAREQHQKDYASLLKAAPHLAHIPQSSFSSQEQMDEALLKSFDEMNKEISEDRRNLDLEDSSSRASLFKYPSLVNSYFAQKSPLKESFCSVGQDLHEKYGPGGWRDLAFDVGVGLAALAGGVVCAFTAGIGCALGVAVLSEGYYLVDSSLNLHNSEVMMQMQLIDSQEVEDARDRRNMALLFAPLSFTGFHSAQALNRQGLTNITLSQSRVLRRDVDLLKSEYVHFQAATPAQNRAWINSARSAKAKLYFDVENAAMKRLNDTLGDKNFVTAATNYHKKIFQDKLQRLKEKYPNLEFQLYSDFKSLRLSFEGEIPKDLTSDLNKIFEETNAEFSSNLKQMNGVDLGQEDPAHWFNAGLGTSADQAGLASRFARTAHRDWSKGQPVIDYDQIKQQLSQGLRDVEGQRSQLFESLPTAERSKIFNLRPAGEKPVLRLEVIELLRKNAHTPAGELRSLFQQRFNAQLTTEHAQTIQDYLKGVDQFSPGLWQEQRVVANLDEASFGGLSVDFKGLGAKNLQQLSKDLSQNSDNIDQAIVAARGGEEVVTQLLQSEKINYQNLVEKGLAKHGANPTNVCSGDDCVSVLDRAIDINGQKDIVAHFSTAAKPSDYRLSFIPPGVRPEHRTHLAVHGELIEKELRKKVSGFGDGLISPAVLDRVNFAVVMPNELGRGNVQLLTGVATDVTLSPAQQRLLQQKFEEALRTLNQELSEGANSTVRYQPEAVEIVRPSP